MANNNIGYFGESVPKELSSEETKIFFQLAKNGDLNAKNKLREHNLRLVFYIINKNFRNIPDEYASVDIEDLISIGIFGLMKAIETFDIEKGIKFATYATRCITNEILMMLRKLNKQKNELSLNISLNEDMDGNNLTIGDIIDTNEDITEYYERRESQDIIKKSLNLLNGLERQVIELRYGFNGEVLTQYQVGQELSLSQSYISRIEAKAKQKLGKYLETQGQGYVKKRPTNAERVKVLTYGKNKNL